MINKDIEKIIDENIDTDNLDEFENEYEPNPCWEVKIDHVKKKILFLINKEEKISFSLSKIKNNITVDLLSGYLKLLRENKIDELRKMIKTNG